MMRPGSVPRFLYPLLAVLFVLGLGFLAYANVSEGTLRMFRLAQCKVYGSATEQSECVFVIIRKELQESGMGAALGSFIQASTMYPRGLDIDCHSGIHRVGDMMYYDIFLADPDISAYEFPKESMICNRGFYHGIFEHLIQDRPDPAFISELCHYFRSEDRDIDAVVHTCFHAAGHGLFRNQAERVPESSWGDPDAFVLDPVRICQTLPDTNEKERYNCTTGVESIFIQTSLQGEYGFRDPDPKNKLAVCDQLRTWLHDPCYFVRALMVSQIDDGYERITRDCIGATGDLFAACIRGTIVGLVVNGVNEKSFDKTLRFCASDMVARRGGAEECYRRLGLQIEIEYTGAFRIDCERFPAEYRSFCPARKQLI